MPCLNESRTLAACTAEAQAGCEATLISRSALAPGSDISRSALAPGSDNSRNATTHGSLNCEILIADNGSTDGSQEIAIANGARVIPVEQKGYGAALLGGLAAAQGKYIVMGDSDSSYDFGDIPKLIAKLEEGYDLVLGNRFAGGIQPGAMPWHHRYIGNPILSGLGKLLYRTPCRDWHCGLRAFDRKKMVALQLKSTGMEFASEMVLRASQTKLRMAEVPTTLRPEGRDRPPYLRSFRDGWRHLCMVFELYSPRPRSDLLQWILIAVLMMPSMIGIAWSVIKSSEPQGVFRLSPQQIFLNPNPTNADRWGGMVSLRNKTRWQINELVVRTSCKCTVLDPVPNTLGRILKSPSTSR
jgi:hypothetical protein